MRIAFFADIFDNHNQKWFRRLSEDHELIVFCQNNLTTPLPTIPGVTVYPILLFPYPLREMRRRKKSLEQIRQLLVKHQVDLLHSIYAFPFAIWAHETGFGKHLITTYGSDVLIDYPALSRHTSFQHRISNYLMRRKMERAFRDAQYITSTSIGQKQVASSIVGESDKLSVVRTGVDTNEFLTIFNSFSNPAPERVILSIRAMQELYNIHVIVDAFAYLKQQQNDSSLQLWLIDYCTDPAYAEQIREQIRSHGLDNAVVILPGQSKEQLIRTYYDAEVVVMVPQSDGTPVTGVETLLSGKPLVMGDLAYDPDLFNEQTVWQTDRNDAKALAQQLIEVLALPETSVQAKTSAGRQAAIEYADLHNEIAKIETLYRKIVAHE